MSQPFIIEKTFDAPPEKVWKAITDKDQMKEWYFNLSEFKAEPGFEFSFAGKGRKGEDYLHICKVTEVIQENKLSHSWSYKGYPGMSEVTFELFPEEESTRMRLIHEGIESFAANGPDFTKESFAEGWTMIIGKSLKDFTEKK